MPDYEQHKINIPACRINKETLVTIGNMFESEMNEFKKTDNDAHRSITFEIETKNKTLKKTSVESLSETRIPRNLERIWFNFYFDSFKNKTEIRISLHIYFNSYSNSYFTVEGRDSNWVSGITHRLQEIFDESKTSNHIFRKTIVKIAISFGILIILGLGISFTTLSYLPDIYDETKNDEYTLTWLTIAGGIMPMYYFLSWLFPQVEFEDYLIQTRIKKIVFSGIGAIILGLLITGISKLFL